MRNKLVLCMLKVCLLWLFAVAAQAQTSTISIPADAELSIEESTRGLPLRREGVIPQGTLIRVSLAIIVGLVLAIVIAYLLKRYLFARNQLDSSGHRMQLLEVKRLSPRLMLYRVRVEDKTIVLAQSGERLIELDPANAFEPRQEAIDDEA